MFSSAKNALERNSESLLLFFPSKRNSEHFFLPRNGSQRNSESLLLFVFHGTEFRACDPECMGGVEAGLKHALVYICNMDSVSINFYHGSLLTHPRDALFTAMNTDQ